MWQNSAEQAFGLVCSLICAGNFNIKSYQVLLTVMYRNDPDDLIKDAEEPCPSLPELVLCFRLEHAEPADTHNHSESRLFVLVEHKCKCIDVLNIMIVVSNL